MGLTETDVRRLATQALELLPGTASVRVVPVADHWRDGRAEDWLILVVEPSGGGEVDVAIDLRGSPAEALAGILETINEHGSEQGDWWGLGLPPCPGHSHGASAEVVDTEVVLSCPALGEPFRRIEPRTA